MMKCAIFSLLASAPVAAVRLSPPDNAGYDPIALLCTFKGEQQPWCADWMTCIKDSAASEGTPASVLAAWKPAECEQFCGVYPVLNLLQAKKDPADASVCMASCKKFQDNLSTCVATVLFEPGKMSVMQGKKPAKEDMICGTDSCMPDLQERHQRCMIKKSKKKLDIKRRADEKEIDCTNVNGDWDHCKECNKYKQLGGSKYTAFVGGCIDQLNSYWQAVHPAQKEAAVPGAQGCAVH